MFTIAGWMLVFGIVLALTLGYGAVYLLIANSDQKRNDDEKG
jgi:hypothetical protein